MSKWALFAAHRYVRAGAAVPREVGPDGRLLLRPWRQRSSSAVQQAERQRAARPQPLWPRLVGFACIALALFAAFDPVGPMTAHVAASASTATGPRLEPIVVENAMGPDDPVRLRFRWTLEGPVTLLLLATDYAELMRREVADGMEWTADAELLALLEAGQTYHVVVRAGTPAQPLQTPLQTFVFR